MLSNLSTKPFATALAWIDFRSALNTNYLWVHSAIFYPESQRDKSQVVSVFKRSFRGSLNVEMRWRPAGEGFSELICILYHPSLKDPLRLTSGVFLRYSNKRQGVCDRVDYKKGGWFPWTRKSFAFMEKRPPPPKSPGVADLHMCSHCGSSWCWISEIPRPRQTCFCSQE